MDLFSSRILWVGWVRSVLFWIVAGAVAVTLERNWAALDISLLSGTLRQAFDGHYDDLSSQPFAFALASGLVALAAALATAFLVLHATLVPLALRAARRRVEQARTMQDFVTLYPKVYAALARHPLVAHPWTEFDKSLVPPHEDDGVYRNTVRPQAYIHMNALRERLVGLKLMGGIPGYFVGVGLLLTFAGLVLALSKAAGGVNSTDPEAMQKATRELLQVATFKFATSIAGLGASIVLSFLFRLFTVRVESSLDRFCRALESRLRYIAPQSMSLEMNEALAGQLAELKQINSADFFARMGQSLQPGIETAFASAMAPVTASIDQAVGRLADSSESGVADLVQRFTDSVQGGAGTELRELAGTLQAMQGSLLDVQRGIHGSGEDFGRRLSDAAENLNKLVSEAGDRLGASSEASRAAFFDVVTALRETMEHANRKVEEGLTQAASGASQRIEEAMGRVMGRLEDQIGVFQTGLGGFQEGIARQLDESGRQVSAAQASAVEAISGASAAAAKALRDGLAESLTVIRNEVERFAASMRSAETALDAQGNAMRETTTQSRAVADAFGRTAQDVRTAAAPLLQSGERIAVATDRMAESVARSVAALESGQAATRELAEAITGHQDQLAATWAAYADRFEGVDRTLAATFTNLVQATEAQGQALGERVRQIDTGFAAAIDRLNPFLSQLTENTTLIGEHVDDLRAVMMPQAAE